jgi:hypothetical protein
VAGAGLNCCPFCGEAIKPLRAGLGEIHCTACGRRLWFVADPCQAWFFTSVAELDRILVFLNEQGKMAELRIDSLDLVELIMELEEGSPKAL